MAPMTSRVKVLKYFWGLLITTSKFPFEVKVILGLESTHLEIRVAKIGFNSPMTNRVKV